MSEAEPRRTSPRYRSVTTGRHATVVLTEEQRLELLPLVRRQAKDRRGLLLVSVAPFIVTGQTALRLQAKFLPWRTANKILKLIRDSEAKA